MKRASRPGETERMVEAVFFAEPRNTVEAVDLAGYAEGLAQVGEVRRLSEGPLVAYAVRLPLIALPLLDALEITLKRDFQFGRVEMPMQSVVLAVIDDVVQATGGVSFPYGTCGVCGEPHPFADPLMLPGEDGEVRPSDKSYCPECARGMGSSTAERKVLVAAGA